jgi:hypothetical protein
MAACPVGTEATRAAHDDDHHNMSNYDQLHRQCRTLENLFDAKLTSYSQLASNLSRPQDVEARGATERCKDLELELDDLSVKVNCILSICASHKL